MKCYIGVDPGNNGGIALIQGNQAIEYEQMPNSKGIRDFFDNAAVAFPNNLVCIFEEHKGGGPQTNAAAHRSAGLYLGMFQMICDVQEIPFHLVRPQEWKKVLGANKDKNRSIRMAEQIFPTVNLLFPRCTIKADGVAEALLIAEYGRRINL
jgi:hypothetical protein